MAVNTSIAATAIRVLIGRTSVQSALRADIGCIPAARNAGRAQATTAVTKHSAATTDSVSGSFGRKPNNKVLIARAA
jgi:hypothetical protein